MTDRAGTIPLAEKVAYLSAMAGVGQVIETHMAFVFLTEEFAFKLKKPVRFGYFDHRTLSARARACAEEVRLNGPLAEGVYLGTVPLTVDGTGLSVTGHGQVVDWLVHMRRLPASRMLDALIAASRSSPTEAERAALVALLARFYRRQQKALPPAGVYIRHLQREQAENGRSLVQMARFLTGIPLGRLTTDLARRLDHMGPEIRAREAAGLVVEGHGDLRPEHVCLTAPPVIFDRVETAIEMRVIDVFDEVGYLGAECALLGCPDLGPDLLQRLEAAGFSPPSPALQTTYAMLRLVTRARLALDHLRDPAPLTPAKWPVRARAYLTEALRL